MTAQHTPGPWRWRRFGKSLALVGQHSDIPIVMDFAREGMQGATARFRNEFGLMCKADRDPVSDDFPDARLIAAAPAMLAALEAAQAREEFEESGEDPEERYAAAWGDEHMRLCEREREMRETALAQAKGEGVEAS